MRKIVLTEEQFKKYIKNEFYKSVFIREGDDKITKSKSPTQFSKDMFDKIYNHMSDKAINGYGDEELDKRYTDRIAQHGINIDSVKRNMNIDVDGDTEYNIEVKKRVQNLLKEKNEIIKQWIASSIEDLRKCYNNTNTFKKGKEQMTKNGVKITGPGYFDLLPSDKKGDVLNLRDFLDREGLTFLYRPAAIPETVKSRYGLELMQGVEYWKAGDKSYEKLDFWNINDTEIDAFYDGTRIKTINNELYKLTNDKSLFNSEKKVDKYSNPELYDKVKEKALEGIQRKVAERYVKRTYGLNLRLGKTSSNFSYGNKKISNDVLIINFTSALRCEAWNECILKDACYARNTEKHYDDTFYRNERNSLIWEQTKDDPELMRLVLNAIKAYAVDYRRAAVAFRRQLGQIVEKETLCEMSFSEIKDQYGEEALDIVKSFTKISAIRLNEDGDFIGQWLVDAWDKEAEDFKLVDINVVAYTCRALNYETIKNIIINVSNENLLNGQSKKTVARFFYTVSEDVYDRLKETYYYKDENGKKQIGFKVNEDTGKVNPMYIPLIDSTGLKGYYYKCPCGRFMDENGVDKQKKLDCYRCRICYGRESTGDIEYYGERNLDVPSYVFVKVHGTDSEKFELDSDKRLPGGREPKEWAEIQQNMDYQLNENTKIIETTGDFVDETAIKQVVKNTVFSIANMMRNGSATELNENKRKFFEMFKKIL